MSASTRAGQQLQKDAVGVFGIVFFVVAAAAPLAAVAGAAPIVFGTSNSIGGPGAFALSGLVLLLFSVGYAAMSSHISGPGGFAVYISRAFGRRAGCAASFTAILAYNAIGLGQYGLLGFLAHPLMADKLGIDLSWAVWAFAFMALVAVLGYRSIDLSAKVLGTLMIGEVAVLLVMNVVIAAKGGEHGLTAAGFAPANVFGGSAGITILFAFASYVGFEATTIYGEEARDRLRTIPRATYAAVLFIAVFYTFTYWAIGVGYGSDGVIKAAGANPGGFIFDLNTHYVGQFSTDVMNWLVMTSVFACILSFHNTITRYLFALGRDGIVHRRLGTTHRSHRSPHVASLVQSAIGLVVIGLFVAFGADPYAQLYAWLVGLGTVGVLVLCTSASVAVFGFLRVRGNDVRLWHSLIAPLAATAGLAVATFLAVKNFSSLTGSTSGAINDLWLLVPAAAIVGWAVAAARADRLAEVLGPDGLPLAP